MASIVYRLSSANVLHPSTSVPHVHQHHLKVHSGAYSGVLASNILQRKNLAALALLTARCCSVSTSYSFKHGHMRSIFRGEVLKYNGPSLPQKPCRSKQATSPVCMVAAADAAGGDVTAAALSASEGFLAKYPTLVTGFLFFMWYLWTVIFNILNKRVYGYFPYPYFASFVHLVVSVTYCAVCWAVGLPKRAPIDKDLLALLTPISICHAVGYMMTNVSCASVAISFTHTVKALEPFLNAAASQFILGQHIPLSLWLSLFPVVIGVAMASLTELSFNWKGFVSAMISNVAFTYRSIYSKKAMSGMDSTNLYAYISIMALFFCIPPALIIEGPALLQHGFTDAIAKVGLTKFLSDLFWVGIFYHLYNQLGTNTLERVAPLTHAVGNVFRRVFVIGFAIIVFGNKISTQTGIGTVLAIAGVACYSIIQGQIEEVKKKSVSSLPDCVKAS